MRERMRDRGNLNAFATTVQLFSALQRLIICHNWSYLLAWTMIGLCNSNRIWKKGIIFCGHSSHTHTQFLGWLHFFDSILLYATVYGPFSKCAITLHPANESLEWNLMHVLHCILYGMNHQFITHRKYQYIKYNNNNTNECIRRVWRNYGCFLIQSINYFRYRMHRYFTWFFESFEIAAIAQIEHESLAYWISCIQVKTEC